MARRSGFALGVLAVSAILFAQADPSSAPDKGEEPARCAPVGTNVTMPAYWTSSYPFVDAMKPSFQFISGGANAWEDDRPLALDEHGWVKHLLPGQLARVFILWDEGRHPTGSFTVLYEGKGRLEYSGSVRRLERRPGRDTFDLEEGGLYLNLVRTDPNDPMRNIRVLLPGGSCEGDPFAHCEEDAHCSGARCVPFEETYEKQPYHPQFLQELRPFAAIRFMDFMLTNREVAQEDGTEEPEPIAKLSEYPVRADKSWRPVPFDVMIDLVNLLGADAWLNMPHQASDELVRAFAKRAARRLRRDLRVYVEYSNETWNTIFDQHHWINAQGCRKHSRDPKTECDGDSDGKLCEHDEPGGRTRERCVGYGRRWGAERAVEVGRIWRKAFEGVGPERVVRVLGVQVDGSWWYEDVLRHRLPLGDPVHQHVDVVAVAPYFSLPRARRVNEVFRRVAGRDARDHGRGVFQVLAGAPGEPDGGMLDWIAGDAKTLSKKGLDHLRLVAYEAGQGLQSYEPEVSAVFEEANRDPRMRKVYRQYLDRWARMTGGGLLMHFSSPAAYNQHGFWGVKEYQGQPRSEAPKYDALVSYIERHRGCGDRPRSRAHLGTPRRSARPDNAR